MKVELEAGDVVRLKSGGPLMTIEEITGPNAKQQAMCSWFGGSPNREPSGNTQLQHASFPVMCLTAINPYANFNG